MDSAVNIELRWLVSKRNDIERTLQFRTAKKVQGSDGFVYHYVEIVWTDWQDVPEVS